MTTSNICLSIKRNHCRMSVFFCIFCLAFMLAGCGSKKDEAVETFQSNVDNFAASILELDAQINNIDASSEDAVSELLSYYDSMEQEFLTLAALEVPDEYSDVTRLSEKAGEYMTAAVSYYHAAFEGNVLDQDSLELANAYYAKSFEFVNYIGQVLMGSHITFQSDLESETSGE